MARDYAAGDPNDLGLESLGYPSPNEDLEYVSWVESDPSLDKYLEELEREAEQAEIDAQAELDYWDSL